MIRERKKVRLSINCTFLEWMIICGIEFVKETVKLAWTGLSELSFWCF